MRRVISLLLGKPRPSVGARVAIVSTPRSGNTWLRDLLARSAALQPLGVHTPQELDWASLPQRCILQIHWHRVKPFEALLAGHGFRVVTLVRHPLDVLISILRFAEHEPDTARWLDGDRGNEASLRGASPISAAFAAYAISGRADVLLSVTRQWWKVRGVQSVRYESLVENPYVELRRISEGLSLSMLPSAIAEAIEAKTMPALRAEYRNQHFWQGQPGLWRKLLTSDVATQIAARHADLFREFAYACNHDSNLTANQANANWHRLNPQRLAQAA